MRVVNFFLMALIAMPVWAEWTKTGESMSTVFYADLDTIRKDGQLVQVFEVQSFKKRDKTGARSARALSEWDCKGERYRILSISTYSKPMAHGKTISSVNAPGSWDSIDSDTADKLMLDLLCSR